MKCGMTRQVEYILAREAATRVQRKVTTKEFRLHLFDNNSPTMPVVSAVSAIDTEAWAQEEFETKHVGELEPRTPMLRYVPRIFRFDRAPVEATALAIDMYARATVVMSSLFLGPALLSLATKEAEKLCGGVPIYSFDECVATTHVYGFRPSSLLSNIAVVSGLIGAFILPPMGAIVDHTSYRRQVGAFSALFITIIKGIEIMISTKTWFIISWLQVATAILYLVHITSIYAYKSELSDVPKEQAKYNTYYYIVMYFSTLVYMVEVLGIAYLLNTGDVGTARIALAITVTTSTILFTFTWTFLFRSRPPLSIVPEGHSVILTGFRKLFRTSWRISSELPALRWFLASLIFGEAANTSVVTIATTYMSQFLKMDSKDIGIVFLAVLIMGSPGSKLGEILAVRLDPPTSAKICYVTYIIVTATAALTLTGPSRSRFTVIFGALWGICLGKLCCPRIWERAGAYAFPTKNPTLRSFFPPFRLVASYSHNNIHYHSTKWTRCRIDGLVSFLLSCLYLDATPPIFDLK